MHKKDISRSKMKVARGIIEHPIDGAKLFVPNFDKTVNRTQLNLLVTRESWVIRSRKKRSISKFVLEFSLGSH